MDCGALALPGSSGDLLPPHNHPTSGSYRSQTDDEMRYHHMFGLPREARESCTPEGTTEGVVAIDDVSMTIIVLPFDSYPRDASLMS